MSGRKRVGKRRGGWEEAGKRIREKKGNEIERERAKDERGMDAGREEKDGE